MKIMKRMQSRTFVETKKNNKSFALWLMHPITLIFLITVGAYSLVMTMLLLKGHASNCHNDHTDHSTFQSEWKIKKQEADISTTPFWWIEGKEDDWFERKYVSDELKYHSVRELRNVKKFFNPMCGRYRFNETLLPDVSVIMPTQNELSGWVTMGVHSILARTPPHLLKEVIVVDDNGIPPEIRGTTVNETEFEELRKLPKVKVIQNHDREGCARSRLVGAKAARGEILMFIDSHVEATHSTWYQHLLIPIIENPRTVSMQTIDIIDDKGKRQYHGATGHAYGKIDRTLNFGWQDDRFSTVKREHPSGREPYETAFGPGSLFAIRKDEFWRLGGYDEGLYIWGGENIELAFKAWMCGGRVVFSPCSRVGHMFRISPELMKKQWPPKVPMNLVNKLGLRSTGTGQLWKQMDDFEKVTLRNNLRVMNIWVGDHPAKYEYYKERLQANATGGLDSEWQKYVDELKTDPAALKQIRKKRENKCHDFEWWDKHVYMKLAGKHHPWYPEPNSSETGKLDVSCGSHRAKNCAECPSGHGEMWCNGDCNWCGSIANPKCIHGDQSCKASKNEVH